MKADSVNDALRDHVTRVGFDLSLGKTHVAALVYLDQCIKQDRYIPANKAESPAFRRMFSWFSSGIRGCCDRGLVVHHWSPGDKNKGLRYHYTITTAGQYVIGLLAEAGIYQEFADALPRLEVVA